MSSESSNSQLEPSSSPFIFEKSKTEKRILAQTKQWANEHLPFPKDYQIVPFYLPKSFEHYGNAFRDFRVRKDDVWVLSFPKSGTTWVQNIVWQLMNGLDLDREPIALHDAQYLEWKLFENRFGEDVNDRIRTLFGDVLNDLNNAPSPRIIKSHLPPNFLPVELWTVRPKIVYIARNPKDVAISSYHMLRKGFKRSIPSLEASLDAFLEDFTSFSPYSSHVLTYWKLRHLENFLFLTYEELSADLFGGVKKISTFLEFEYGDEELRKLMDYVSFGNMQKKNTKEMLDGPERGPQYNFFRKGNAGGFVDEMTKEYIDKFDRWTEERFGNSGFKFDI